MIYFDDAWISHMNIMVYSTYLNDPLSIPLRNTQAAPKEIKEEKKASGRRKVSLSFSSMEVDTHLPMV